MEFSAVGAPRPTSSKHVLWQYVQSMISNTLYLPELREMLAQHDEAGLREFCVAVHPAAAAEFTDGLTLTVAWEVLKHTDSVTRSEIFSFYDLARQVEIIEALDRDEMAELIGQLAPTFARASALVNAV